MATPKPYSRTVTFTSPSANVRQVAAKRTARITTHFVHTRYVRRFSNVFRAH